MQSKKSGIKQIKIWGLTELRNGKLTFDIQYNV